MLQPLRSALGPIRRRDGAPEKIRTSDLQLRRLPLYPAELRARFFSLARLACGFASPIRLTAHTFTPQHQYQPSVIHAPANLRIKRDSQTMRHRLLAAF